MRMVEPHDDGRPRLAWLQLTLGVVQIAGATSGLLLLLAIGVNRLSVGIVALTLCLTVLSRILFPRHR